MSLNRTGERCKLAASRLREPRIKIIRLLGRDHGSEAVQQVARRDESRRRCLDRHLDGQASAELQWHSVVSRRAITRDVGMVVAVIPACSAPVFLARRLRVAHSLTTRELPPNPASRRRRQSFAPLRHPLSHSAVNRFAQWSRVLSRDRNMSSRLPRRTRRTVWRDTPVILTAALMLWPS